MKIIFTIGIFIALFQFVLLLNKKSKSLPDTILAVWMLVIGIHLTSSYINSEGFWEIYPHLIGVTVPFPFFYGPLLYLYIFYSFNNNHQLRKQDYLHFLPVVSTYLYMFRFYFFFSAEEKRLVDRGVIDDFEVFSNVLLVAIIVSGVAYSIYANRLLSRYKLLVESNFSNTELINLNWLRSFIWGVGLIFLTVIIVLITRDLMGLTYPFNPDFIFYSMLVGAILSLGYFGIRHQNIFTDNLVVEIAEKTKSTYQKSSLKDDLAREKHNLLTDLMVSQKPYLDPNLTLNSLAQYLEIPPHHLSQIINQFEEQNFNDFVNKYRVEEFIDRASQVTHLSFLGIALDSGFNSKSTFNTVFKKHKGTTPSQYMSSPLRKAS
ncbi:MAG: helix-turn-helix domain-containing protein [Cyclobacteriaceae bacterium]|nr:helix-turn-helix domain-containing protein [Cyclobacteriaceae bacterium]